MKGSCNTGGGGGINGGYSTIVVNYTAGTTVAITPSTKSAEISSTQTMFYATEVGTYTLTATKDELTYEQFVTVDALGQYLNVEINYLVPIEYQAVEYLKSSKTQYILTGIAPTNTRFGFEFDVTPVDAMSTSGYGVNFGSRQSSTVNEFAFGTYTSGTTGGIIRMKGSSYSAYLTRYVRQLCKKHLLVYTRPDHGGVLTVTDATLGNYPICLFALNQAGSIIQHCESYVYSFKVFDDNDDLVLDLQPCYRKSDSVAGMYDRVSGNFLTNSGTGTFVVGEDI